MNRKKICHLCKSDDTRKIYTDKQRSYYLCSNCKLIFVSSIDFLNAKEEKLRYDFHENDIYNPGYRKWLNNIFVEVKNRIPKNAQGLDFGSGPEPSLSVLFGEVGYSVTNYDVFYAKNNSAFQRKYDFITASEVVEHLQEPQKELFRLWSCLKAGGVLGIMTGIWKDVEKFQSWVYKDDLTHICFFAKQTFIWLSKQWNAEITFIKKNLIIFKKPD